MAEMIIQSPDEVVAFLKAQHNLIEDMFDQVLHASDPKAREEPFTALRQLLAVHETAEEVLSLHPDLVAVVTNLTIPCGSDASLNLYRRTGTTWTTGAAAG